MNDENVDIKKDRASRLVCAKLYEGGLFSAYSILRYIKTTPFKAKSPEVGINIDLVTKHAENAYRYHLKFALLAAGFTFFSLIFFSINTIFSGFLAAAVIFLIIWKSSYIDRKIALENFSKISYNPNYKIEDVFPERNLTKQEKQEESKNQNVIIFGGYFPFLGAGYRIGYWNFVIDTTKSTTSFDVKSSKPHDINIDEIYKSVSEDIIKKNLPNISEEFLLFADGKELKEGFLLPTRIGEPISNLDPQILFSEGHKSLYEEYRTYYRIMYYDMTRDKLFSTYLRFSKVGTSIFAESSFYVLPPIDENTYDIDKSPLYDELLRLKVGISAIVISIFAAFIFVISGKLVFIPFLILSWITFKPPLIILKDWLIGTIYNKMLKNEINKGETHNYGNLQTFRESIANPIYRDYFSAQDIIMIRGIIEKTIIYSIADLLDSKEIDSSFLRDNLIPFVNQGILMYGGKMEAEQVAVGKGATSMKLKERFEKQGGSAHE